MKQKLIGLLSVIIGAIGVYYTSFITYRSFAPRATTTPAQQAPSLRTYDVAIENSLIRELDQKPSQKGAAVTTPVISEALVFLERPNVTRTVTSKNREAMLTERRAFINDLKTQTQTIQQHVVQSMAPLISTKQITIKKSFYIDNILYVSLTKQGLEALAKLPGIRAITQNYRIPLPKPATSTTGLEWNISNIQADKVWSDLGITGNGTVVANIDTGVRYDHESLNKQYRGWDGSAYSHDYNWFDPTGAYPSAPGDNAGHGTHTMGTMVGGGNPEYGIGVAPGAKWIAVKGCGGWWCDASSLLSSAEWILAPTKLDGSDPDPSKAPDVVNNSWGGGSCSSWYQGAIQSWRNAGIVPVFSQGNSGPTEGSANSPGDNPLAIGVGATDSNNTIASFSSRGPSCATFGSEIKPEVSAPGVSVLSSVPDSTNSYSYYSGTSMAAPHVAGAIALMRSAKKDLTIDTIEKILQITSEDFGAPGPDNDYGAGKINALSAVTAVQQGGTVLGTVKDSTTQQPISNAKVVLQSVSNPSRIWNTIAASGSFMFEYVLPGQYTLTTSYFGYATQSTSISITASQSLEQNISLVKLPTYTISGKVTNNQSQPLIATIRLIDTPITTVTSNPDGMYAIQDVPAGTYTLDVKSPGYKYAAINKSVTVTGNTTRDIALTPLPSIPVLHTFENGLQGWSTTGFWHIVEAQQPCGLAHKGTHSAYFGGTFGACNYDSGIVTGELTSPLFYIPNVTQDVSLEFYSWYETESQNEYWDKRIIEIKEENETTWTQVEQLSGDPMNQWLPKSIFLNTYKNKNVQIRFRFDSVDGSYNNYRGWYIDDVNLGIHGAELTVSETGPAQAAIGETITYEVEVTNTGDRVAENTILTNTWTAPENVLTARVASVKTTNISSTTPFPSSSPKYTPTPTATQPNTITIPLGTIYQDQTAIVSIKLTVSQNAKRTDVIHSIASVSTSSYELNPSNNTYGMNTTVISPELELTGKGTVTNQTTGRVRYDFSVTNIGELPATNVTSKVTISAPFPWGITQLAADNQETALSNTGSFVMNFGTLSPGEKVSIIYAVKPSQPANGSFDVVATATTDSKESYPTNTVHLVTPIAPVPTPTPTPTPTPIQNQAPIITTTSLPNAIIKTKYTATINATDANKDTMSMTVTNLPKGMSKGPCTQTTNADGIRSLTCTIQGTTLSAGTYTINVTVTDQRGAVAKRTLKLIVSIPPIR